MKKTNLVSCFKHSLMDLGFPDDLFFVCADAEMRVVESALVFDRKDRFDDKHVFWAVDMTESTKDRLIKAVLQDVEPQEQFGFKIYTINLPIKTGCSLDLVLDCNDGFVGLYARAHFSARADYYEVGNEKIAIPYHKCGLQEVDLAALTNGGSYKNTPVRVNVPILGDNESAICLDLDPEHTDMFCDVIKAYQEDSDLGTRLTCEAQYELAGAYAHVECFVCEYDTPDGDPVLFDVFIAYKGSEKFSASVWVQHKNVDPNDYYTVGK